MLCFALPSLAKEIFNDGCYSFSITKKGISYFKKDNQLLYDLELKPIIQGFNNDTQYKVRVFHYLNTNYISIYSMDAYSKNGEYLFLNNEEKEIQNIIQQSSEKIKNYIFANYTNCINYKYDSNNLYCTFKEK